MEKNLQCEQFYLYTRLMDCVGVASYSWRPARYTRTLTEMVDNTMRGDAFKIRMHKKCELLLPMTDQNDVKKFNDKFCGVQDADGDARAVC